MLTPSLLCRGGRVRSPAEQWWLSIHPTPHSEALRLEGESLCKCGSKCNLITSLLTDSAARCSHPERITQPEKRLDNPDSTDEITAQPYAQAYTNVCTSATVLLACCSLLQICLRASCHVCLQVPSDFAPAGDECMDQEEGDDAEYAPDAVPDAGDCLASFCWPVLLGFRNCRCFNPDCQLCHMRGTVVLNATIHATDHIAIKAFACVPDPWHRPTTAFHRLHNVHLRGGWHQELPALQQ